MKKVLILLVLGLAFCFVQAQGTNVFHITILDSTYIPTITTNGEYVIVVFENDEVLTALLSNHAIYRFGLAYSASRYPDMHKVWEIRATMAENLMGELMAYRPDIFVAGEMQPEAELLYTPNDYGFIDNGRQTDLDLINAKTAWNITHGSPNIVIGVTDTEFDVNHPDLQGQIANVRTNSQPSATTFHGTSVLGRIAAATDNNIGISGIGFGCKLDISKGVGNSNMMLQMSKDGVRVVNGSWLNLPTQSIHSSLYGLSARLIYNEIYENGTTACFGAGNARPTVEGNATNYVYPASYDHNISVSSVGHENAIGTISYWPGNSTGLNWNWKDVHEKVAGNPDTHQHNNRVDICAPGFGLTMLLNSNHSSGQSYTIGNGDGTSFASPQVAGTVGLMLSANNWLSPYQVEWILKQTTADLHSIPENSAYIGKLGAGRIDAGGAVALAQNYNCNTLGTQTFHIKGIDINTICRPGLSTNGVVPTLSPITEYGTPPYTYQWEPLPGNTASLSSTAVANPSITSSTGTHLLHYYLTIFDSSPIQKVAHKKVKVYLKDQQIYDIAGRDSYMDMLIEPNDQAVLDPREWDIWQSPDIWNRRFQDNQTAHENPEYFNSNPNYVYMKVRNVGCAPTPANMNVRLYWTKASTGEDWPDDWTITTYTNPSGQVIPAGGEITTSPINIQSLQPGDYTLVSHPWYPIQPQQYDPTINSVDVCVLGRIEETNIAPFGMTFPEVTLLKSNVNNNNNSITRNLVVSDIFPGNKPIRRHLVFAGNAQDLRQNFEISMRPERSTYRHFAGNFGDVGTITLYLGDLFNIWQNSGGEGDYERIDFEKKTVSFNGNTDLILKNIPMSSKATYPIIVEIKTLTGNEYSEVPHTFSLSQHLIQGGRKTLYGNIDFSVQTQRNESEGHRHSSPDFRPFIVYPNPTEDVFYVENKNIEIVNTEISIYDLSGKRVYYQPNCTLNPDKPLSLDINYLKQGLYFVKIGSIDVYKVIKK